MEAAQDEQNEERQAFLSLPHNGSGTLLRDEKHTRKASRYLRVTLECAMAFAIVALLVRLPSSSCGKESRRSPVPEFSRKTYTFVEDKRYLHEDMFENNRTTLTTLHNWIVLSADARGYVRIPDAESYDLGEPYTVPISRDEQGPAYMMSVFHQLHCLSYLVEHFQAGFGGVKLSKEVAHHSAHCFDYIRQAIMCAADTSLEGLTEAGPGWGSKHECKDYDAVLEWANKHGALAWRNTLLPDDSTL